MGRYDEIINLDRPPIPEELLSKYPPMSNKLKAKIYMPFKALRGTEDIYQEVLDKKNYITKPLLDDDTIDHINFVLTNLKRGDTVSVDHFVKKEGDKGVVETTQGTVARLDMFRLDIILPPDDTDPRKLLKDEIVKVEIGEIVGI